MATWGSAGSFPLRACQHFLESILPTMLSCTHSNCEITINYALLLTHLSQNCSIWDGLKTGKKKKGSCSFCFLDNSFQKSQLCSDFLHYFFLCLSFLLQLLFCIFFLFLSARRGIGLGKRNDGERWSKLLHIFKYVERKWWGVGREWSPVGFLFQMTFFPSGSWLNKIWENKNCWRFWQILKRRTCNYNYLENKKQMLK